MRTLKSAAIGETVHISHIHGSGPLQRRMMDLGLIKGSEVSICKVAPFGDPIIIKIKGYKLFLRK